MDRLVLPIYAPTDFRCSGPSGRCYQAGSDRTVLVLEEDTAYLLRQDFTFFYDPADPETAAVVRRPA